VSAITSATGDRAADPLVWFCTAAMRGRRPWARINCAIEQSPEDRRHHAQSQRFKPSMCRT
jgi:hypothetical protein